MSLPPRAEDRKKKKNTRLSASHSPTKSPSIKKDMRRRSYSIPMDKTTGRPIDKKKTSSKRSKEDVSMDSPSRPHKKKTKNKEDSSGRRDFALSGRLAAEANTVNGVVLKYTEPPEARAPTTSWRIYVFKDGKDIDMHHADGASGYLFGRDRKVADIPTDHPSCSSQHAVLQYRQVPTQNGNSIKPYLIDLASTNGTFLNGEQIPAQRYVELRSEDVIKFGFSTREYVILNDLQS